MEVLQGVFWDGQRDLCVLEYTLFKDKKDPETGGDFFVANHEEIFLKELKYVQRDLYTSTPSLILSWVLRRVLT